jgi:hypothetical protein
MLLKKVKIIVLDLRIVWVYMNANGLGIKVSNQF